jgi:hypothetical protein
MNKKNMNKKNDSDPFFESGQSTFTFIAVVFLILLIMIGAYFTVTQTNLTTSGHNKATNTAIQAADAAINQLISDISNRSIDVLGTTMPMSQSYPVTTTNGTISVPVTLDFRYSGGVPVTDLEGNNRYLADATVSINAVGAKSTTTLTRHVQSDISIINLARYSMFVTANHIISGSGISVDGPYHCNGNLSVGGTLYFNASKLASGSANPFWSDSYVAMVSGSFNQYVAYTVYTMSSGASNAQAYISSSPSYTVVATATRPSGTWLDSANGGFTAEQKPIPFTTYTTYAQAIIETSNLPTFRYNGVDNISNNLTIDAGITGQSNIVKINLNALGTGTDEDICLGMTNFVNALTSQYGLLIYVVGSAGVYGRVPTVAGAANTNKRITIAATQNIEILGDVLYSGDVYNSAGDVAWDTSVPTPVAATSNPNNDAISLICTGNIYINPGRKTDTNFFINSTEMKIDGFLYSETGMIAQGTRSFKAGYSSTIGPVTYFGAQTKRQAGAYSASPHICYDPLLSTNVSKIIPVGIAINSWREVQ